MSDLTDSDRPYADNWKIHEKLVENVEVRMGQLNQQIAVRDGIAQDLERNRESAHSDPAQIKTLEAQLFDSEKRVEQRRGDLAGARQEVNSFEWSVPLEQRAWPGGRAEA